MPPKLQLETLIKKAVGNNKDLKIDGKAIVCMVCEEQIKSDRQHISGRVKEHIGSQKHHKNQELKGRNLNQSLISESLRRAQNRKSNENEFHLDLAKAFIEANIPLYKLSNPSIKNLFEKFMRRSIPDESTLRKSCINTLYINVIDKIKSKIGNNFVFFIIDETTDACNRYVLNIMVGSLNGSPDRPILLYTTFLEKTNYSTVSQAFNNACLILWPNGIQYDRVLLVVSDQAKYMLKSFKNLKTLFPCLHHITCLAHALHRVCECIREKFEDINFLVSSMKKVLVKSPQRRQIFKEETELCLPSVPVITRWGTWFKSVFFYLDNFEKVSDFISKLPDDSKAIRDAKKLFRKQSVQNDLLFLNQYRFLHEEIEKLETRKLKLETQLEILNSVKSKLEGEPLQKLEESLIKNPDFIKFTANQELEHRLKTLYAPLVSVEVERSFSKFKLLLSDKRHNYTIENIAMLNIIQFNAFLEQL